MTHSDPAESKAYLMYRYPTPTAPPPRLPLSSVSSNHECVGVGCFFGAGPPRLPHLSVLLTKV